MMEETYDYVIIGSGPSGCAIARSLIENINQKV
jgi:choline dehydrogenase-like flavoprotein